MGEAPVGSRVRRSPTAEQLLTWRTFIESTERIRNAMESDLQSNAGLSSSDYSVLLALSEAPDRRLRPSVLADRVGWERSRLSHHIARMQKRGLVDREECLTDNRGAEVVLAAAGASLFRRASAPHLRAIQEIFLDALSPTQLAALEDASLALEAHLNTRSRTR